HQPGQPNRAGSLPARACGFRTLGDHLMAIPTDEIARLSQYNASPLDVPYTMVGPNGYGYVVQWVSAVADTAAVANWIAGLTATLVVSPDNSASQIIALTQSAYDALETVDESTLYVIVGN